MGQWVMTRKSRSITLDDVGPLPGVEVIPTIITTTDIATTAAATATTTTPHRDNYMSYLHERNHP